MRLPLTFAAIDAVAALVLLWRLPSQKRNKASVLTVALLLLGIAGWLAVLSATHASPRPPAQVPPAPQPTPAGPLV